MSKTRTLTLVELDKLKKQIRSNLENNYFRLWNAHFKFTELNRFQTRFMLKEFWKSGTVGVFQVKHLEGAEGLLFAPYDPLGYNEYFELSKVQAINITGSKVVPTGEKTVNKDAVLMWCNSGRRSIVSMIQYYIDRQVEIEIAIRNNFFANASPYMVAVSPESKDKANDLVQKLFNGEPVIFQDVEDATALNVLVSGSNFIADKLVQLKDYYNDQVLGIIFGVDHKSYNAGSDMQFSTVDNDTADMTATNLYSQDIVNCIQTGLDEIKEAFGITITMENTVEEARSIYEEKQENAIQPSKEEKNEQ